MKVAYLIFVCFALCFIGCTKPGDLSISEQEGRLEAIDVELSQLANLSLRSGVGSIGCRSPWYERVDSSSWMEVDLGENRSIDQVVLVPVLRRDIDGGFQADAFPSEFRVLAGTAEDRQGTVIAEYSESDTLLPRIAPLVVPVGKMMVSWVRVEAVRLTPRGFDGRYVFQLSELLVFSGPDNVALHQPVTTSFEVRPDLSGAWSQRFLVNGAMPYLMNSPQGSQSLAYVSDTGVQPNILTDLGEEHPITGIHLHAVDQDDTVPQTFAGDLGIPRHLRIEGANLPDFSDAAVLLDYRWESINETSPIMMWNIPETKCRYVKLSVIEPSLSFDMPENMRRVGFAEIELLSHGRNVALNCGVTVSMESKGVRNPSALTDGENLYGRILPLRKWLSQLARRHELTNERSVRTIALSRQYARQKSILVFMSWAILALVVMIGFVILYGRTLRIRQESRVRERIAANLHDELGANLYAIGMLGDIAENSVHSPERLVETLRRIRSLTQRTGTATRICANMMEASDVCQDLVEEMKRDAARLLADLDHDIVFEGEGILNGLKRRRRVDIFLFYKECLTNIIRHAQATQVSINVSANNRDIVITVYDDGRGYSGDVPASLQRRARLMGGNVRVEHPESGGTSIILKLQTSRWWG
ncbi:sensor histidine kinase [Haloferula sp.]|uniref:sensor histidine kinase n=1 Tax=Haloferula sp. TaxID=2497595 RepID=UPI00329F5515